MRRNRTIKNDYFNNEQQLNKTAQIMLDMAITDYFNNEQQLNKTTS